MATARDKLVADWRHELHAAQDALAASPRQVWLARMRVRLYRFLLRCYGKANWRTSPAPRDETDGVVFDQPEVRFLHGKPAKSAGKIQAVLKSVANAHEPIESGRFTREAARSFVPIAIESPIIDTLGVFAALKREGIEARHVVHDGKDMVEVRATDFYRAEWLLHCFQISRSARPWRVPQFINTFAEAFGEGLATAPFVGMFVSMLFMVSAGGRENAGLMAVTVGLVWLLAVMAVRIAQQSMRALFKES